MHVDREPNFDCRATTLAAVAHLFHDFHVYRGSGKVATYVFAVFENDVPVAAYAWQPPPPASARSVCPECPQGVLSLSRMVALPHESRKLKHVSKPLRHQMRRMIDRTRWPVLVTYSDESVSHTGHVYKCSGWTKTSRRLAVTYTLDGVRVSRYSDGKTAPPENAIRGSAWIQRWEHRVADPVGTFDAAWERVAIAGKKWRSGAQAHTYRKRQP